MSQQPKQTAETSRSEPLAEQAIHVIEDVEQGRFELRAMEEVLSFANIRVVEDVVVIPHVETPPQHRGKGFAGQLMRGLLEILERTDRRLKPLCPYAARYVQERPEHHHLLA